MLRLNSRKKQGLVFMHTLHKLHKVKAHKEVMYHVSPFARPCISSLKLLDEFRLNLVLEVYSKSRQCDLILIHISPM